MLSKISSMIWENQREAWYQVKCPCTLMFVAAAIGFSAPHMYRAGVYSVNWVWVKLQQRFGRRVEKPLPQDLPEEKKDDESSVVGDDEFLNGAGDAPEDY